MPSTPFARGTSIHMAIMPWQRLYSPAATIASLFCNRARVIDPVDPTVQSKVMMTMMVVDLMMVVMVVTVVMVVVMVVMMVMLVMTMVPIRVVGDVRNESATRL